MNVDTTNLSSKGQIVIPQRIRERLGMDTGTKFLIFTDGSNVLLKPISSPKMKTFQKLVQNSTKLVQAKGLKKSDLKKIIK